MPTLTPAQFWTLLTETGLADRDRVAGLRNEFEIESLAPSATPEAVTEAIAKWLVRRQVITRWQARRLARGDRGPFFMGDYRLLERLEKDSYQGGGRGHLFRARHEPSGRVVLLMLLDPEKCRDLEVWTDIVQRTTAVNRVADPLLARTWALEQSGGQRFIICEDVAGTPLTPELAARGPRPIAEVGPVMLSIARAVAELHRLGVVHGGISLEALRREPPPPGGNISAGRVRLLQFPLVADPHVVPPRPVVDTPEAVARLGTRAAFIAPELLVPGAANDPRCDVYAIGCLMQALLTGRLPCWQGDPAGTLSQAAFVGPEPPTPPLVPPEAAALVSYMVARDPQARYRSAAEAADAIAACLGMPPVSSTLPAQQPFIGIAAAAAAPAAPVPPGLAAPRVGPAALVVPTEPARAPQRRRNAWVPYALGAAAIAAVGIGGLFAASRGGAAPKPKKPAPAPVEAVADAGAGARVDTEKDASESAKAEPSARPTPEPPAPERVTTLVDSEELPWASPTDGQPPRLVHLPPGSQLVLMARPADLLSRDEGRLLLRALGGRVEKALAAVTSACGCDPEEIELVQAGWQADPDTGPDAVVGGYAVWGKGRLPVADDEARRTAWGQTTSRVDGGETLHVGKPLSYWLPSDGRGEVLVAAPEKQLVEMVKVHASARDRAEAADWRDRIEATLSPGLEDLVGMLDEERHLTVFGSPSYLLHDGRPVFAGPLAKLVDPLAALLGDDSAAAALSLHCDGTFYAEIDAIAPATKTAKGESAELAARIASLADTVEEYCNALDPHPFGRKLVMRLPRMLGIVAANVRAAAEGKGIVVNCHLPEHAGHNLTLAAELALEQTPGAGVAVASVAAPAAAQSAAERMAKRISLVFARDTLEKSIQMLSEEVGVPMEILGKDLELEGITKNQSFGLDARDQTAEEILLTILARSNIDGKLVYVVRKKDGAESIDITTRAAAAKRGDQLPPAFSAAAAKTKAEEPPAK